MDETDRLSWQQILRLNFISWFHLLEREKEKKLLFISRTQVQGAIGTEKRKEFWHCAAPGQNFVTKYAIEYNRQLEYDQS